MQRTMGLCADGDTPQQALGRDDDRIAAIIEDSLADGEALPPPSQLVRAA